MLNINEQTMEAYKQKAKAHLKEINARMQIVEANAEKAGADVKIKYQKNIDDWKSRFSDIETKLEKLSDSTGDAWKDIRSGIDSAMDELNNTIDKAKKQFNN